MTIPWKIKIIIIIIKSVIDWPVGYDMIWSNDYDLDTDIIAAVDGAERMDTVTIPKYAVVSTCDFVCATFSFNLATDLQCFSIAVAALIECIESIAAGDKFLKSDSFVLLAASLSCL